MSDTTTPRASFAYQAQTIDGRALTGTIDAESADSARLQLESLQLRVLELRPEPARTGAVRGEDFIAFNQQLAYLTAAGMPVEKGLRLIAQDLRGGVAGTIRRVAEEMEQGRPLG